ncbi:hypothetical protein Acr_05g0010730 [Actinidia rufa]|uniref:Uncharacterized protein n=1 Tax=Actinidia rufa TaxID=165716 RepID=A0A7J0ELT4_9ERIC|nr:hypothetical protein Acr_05g0010730 [Actinidia rufa]
MRPSALSLPTRPITLSPSSAFASPAPDHKKMIWFDGLAVQPRVFTSSSPPFFILLNPSPLSSLSSPPSTTGGPSASPSSTRPSALSLPTRSITLSPSSAATSPAPDHKKMIWLDGLAVQPQVFTVHASFVS